MSTRIPKTALAEEIDLGTECVDDGSKDHQSSSIYPYGAVFVASRPWFLEQS